MHMQNSPDSLSIALNLMYMKGYKDGHEKGLEIGIEQGFIKGVESIFETIGSEAANKLYQGNGHPMAFYRELKAKYNID